MKKFRNIKKHFLAATLVLSLGAAVYLNWSLSSANPVSKTLGESKYVNATLSTEATKSTAKETSAKADNSNLTSKQKTFFAEAETKRKQTQDEIIDKANSVLELETTSENERTQAQLQVAGVIKSFTQQDSIETTLKAKGFTKALCYVNELGCAVTVPKKELNDSTSMIIKATVKSITNMDFDKITIVAV